MLTGNNRKKFYDQVQKDKRETLGYYPEKIAFILKETGEYKKVLDVGCNDGYIGEIILKQHNTVFGCDIVERNLQIARSRGLIVKKVDLESDDLPYNDNFFDVVIMGDIIEHVFDTDELIKKCRKVLKKGGKLIVSTPNVASFGRRIMLFFGRNPFLEYSKHLPINGLPSVGHIRYYTVNNLINQLESHKFRIEHVEGNCLNLFLFSTRLFNKLKPSLCMMIICSAIKK